MEGIARAMALIGLTALVGCGSDLPPITDCRDVNDIHPICGMQNPEDLAVLEGDTRLIVSQYADMTAPEGAGNIAVLDLRDESLHIAYPPTDRAARTTPSQGWGDANCPGPPSPLNPHGIDLAQRSDGRWQLLVVNHAGRESIEFLEVLQDGPQVQVVWRGCVIPPEIAYLNDVVHLPGGGFLTTHMMEFGSPFVGMIKAMLGMDTGWVYEWHADRGFSQVPGSEAPFPNGIEISDDGSEVYLNAYMADEVRRISRTSGELLATAAVPGPDNVTWSKDGKLLVASHVGETAEQMACMSLEEGACPMSFEIVALDPDNLEGGAIFANRGPPMGAGTVAVDVGGELVMGSFAGDRVIRARMPRR
jgi:hypothetical protein